jgi:D-sedoheptulose 7-phosphate isomerase
MAHIEEIKKNFIEASTILEKFITDGTGIPALEAAGDIMVAALAKGNKIISCGNGGSMCDAMHFAEELTGRFRENRKSFPAIAISDPSHISCAANDYGYQFAFSRYIEGMGNTGDVLLSISTSGNSESILNAAREARAKGMKIVALTGSNGGELSKLCDVEIRAPKSNYSDRVQEIHIKIIHSLIHYIELNLQND